MRRWWGRENGQMGEAGPGARGAYRCCSRTADSMWWWWSRLQMVSFNMMEAARVTGIKR